VPDSGFQDSVDRTREAFRRVAPEGHDVAPPRPESWGPTMDHDADRTDVAGGQASVPPGLHPFFQGLLDTLPEPGADWPRAKRDQWLETARSIFSLLYRDPAEERGAGRLFVAPPAPAESEVDRYSA